MRGRAGGSLSLLPGYGFGSRPGRTRRDAGKATDASLGTCFALVASSTTQSATLASPATVSVSYATGGLTYAAGSGGSAYAFFSVPVSAAYGYGTRRREARTRDSSTSESASI